MTLSTANDDNEVDDKNKMEEALDFYKVLELPRDCSTEEIKKKYRKLSLLWHPDKCQDSTKREDYQAQFIQISQAFHVLSDEARRKRYDSTGAVEEIAGDVDLTTFIQELYEKITLDQVKEFAASYKGNPKNVGNKG